MAAELCKKCKQRESTGVIFCLCDPCFDEFEAKGKAAGVRVPTDDELEFINEPWLDRSKN